MYVDPTNYDSPEDALSEFASELDPSVLFLEMLIGGGRKTNFLSFVTWKILNKDKKRPLMEIIVAKLVINPHNDDDDDDDDIDIVDNSDDHGHDRHIKQHK